MIKFYIVHRCLYTLYDINIYIYIYELFVRTQAHVLHIYRYIYSPPAWLKMYIFSTGVLSHLGRFFRSPGKNRTDGTRHLFPRSLDILGMSFLWWQPGRWHWRGGTWQQTPPKPEWSAPWSWAGSRGCPRDFHQQMGLNLAEGMNYTKGPALPIFIYNMYVYAWNCKE